MSYIVQKRDPSQQMQSLFHHSLIKMVVMHQLQQKGIPWEVFIAHEVFTNPQAHPQRNMPSSSHPPVLTPPSSPTDHATPYTHIPSPQDNPPSSPSWNALDNDESENEQSSDHEGEGNDHSSSEVEEKGEEVNDEAESMETKGSDDVGNKEERSEESNREKSASEEDEGSAEGNEYTNEESGK